MVLECTCGFSCGSAKAFEKHLARFPGGGHNKVGEGTPPKAASNEVPPPTSTLDPAPDSARSRDSVDSAEEAADLAAGASTPPLETSVQQNGPVGSSELSRQSSPLPSNGSRSRQTSTNISQPRNAGGGLSAAFGLSAPQGADPPSLTRDVMPDVPRPPPIQVPQRRNPSKQSAGLSAAFGITVPSEPLQKPVMSERGAPVPQVMSEPPPQQSRVSSKGSTGLSGAFGLSPAPKSPVPAGKKTAPRTPPGVPKLALTGVNAMASSPHFGSAHEESKESDNNDRLRTTPRRNITPRGTTPRGEPAENGGKSPRGTPRKADRMISQEEADRTRDEEIQKALQKAEQEWKDKLAEAEKREDEIADRAAKHRKEMEQARKERERADKEVQQLKRDLAAEVEKVEQARAQEHATKERVANDLEKVKLELAAQDVKVMKLRAEATNWLETQLVTERAAMSDVLNKCMERRHTQLMMHFENLIHGRPSQQSSSEDACVGCSGFGCALCGPQSSKTGDGIFDTCVPVVPVVKLDETVAVQEKSGHHGLQLVAAEPMDSERQPMDSEPQSRSNSKESQSKKRQKNAIPGSEREEHEGSRLQQLVMGSQFEICFGVFIMLNAVVMAIQVQYEGDKTAHILGYKGMGPPEDRWNGAGTAFTILEWLFGSIFTIEVSIKLMARRSNFFRDTMWNVFDLIVVSAWIIDRVVAQLAFADLFTYDPTVLRIARLARLARLLRVMRWLQIVDPLILMVKAVKASVSVLIWSVLLLVMLVSLIAMTINVVLEPWVRDPSSTDFGTRVMIFESWGTYTRAMESMCEITIGNFGPPTRELMNGVAEYWGALVLLYKLTIGFAVVQVITSVFIQQTFKVASRDEEVMIKEKASAANAYQKNLLNLFEYLDDSGDGMISKEEFMTVSDDPRVRMWLSALDVEIDDVTQIFDMLATSSSGSDEISRDEFLRGVKSLKGHAKGTDLMVLSHEMRKNFKSLSDKVSRINPSSTQNGMQRQMTSEEQKSAMKALKVQQVQRVSGTPLGYDGYDAGGFGGLASWENEKAFV